MQRFISLSLGMLFLGLAAVAPAQEESSDLIKKGIELARRLSDDQATDFIRVVKGKTSSRLETAAVTYEDIDAGTAVTLIGAVHIADKSYYEDLQKHLADYDLVLFEGIERDEEKVDDLLLMVGQLQRLMKGALKLEFQPEQMDMTKENMVRADIASSQLRLLLEERGVGLVPNENMIRTLFPFLESGFKYLSDDGKPEGRLKTMFREKLKSSMADMLGGGLEIYEKLKRKEDRLRDEVIIVERNAVAFVSLKAALKEDPDRKIAILYGAAHQPDFESRLVEDLKLEKTNTRWFAAWRMGDAKKDDAKKDEAKDEEPEPTKKI